MGEDVPTPTIPRYSVRLSGIASVARYGVIEYLRTHRFLRALVAVLGVASGLLGFYLVAGFSVSGFKIAELNFHGSVTGLGFLIAASALLWHATVSGSEFAVVFREAQASEERETAERKFEESQSPEDALNLDFTRLNEYYVINQAQARSSYRWAIFSMLVGLSTIIAGVWLFYFRTSEADKFMASLTTAAGCVVNVISGLFLFVYSRTQERSLHYYEQLSRLQKISLAMRLVGEHTDADKQSEARNLVIRQLLSESNAADASQTSQSRSS